MEWDFRFVDYLVPDKLTGKLQFFVNETKNEKETFYE